MTRHIAKKGHIAFSCARTLSTSARMFLALIGMHLGSCGNSPPSLPVDASSQGPRLHFLKSWQGTGYFLLENNSNNHIKLLGIKADDGTIYVEYGADYLCKYKDFGDRWLGMLEIRDYLSRSEFDVAPGSERQIAFAYPFRHFHPSPTILRKHLQKILFVTTVAS
jgi:hypothetical protein